MVTFSIRSVLGETRRAEVRPGDGFPWVSCPFCGYGVYLGAAHPEAVESANGHAVGGVCNNPWCIANPNMPVDAARMAVAEAHLKELAELSRQANHEAAMERIEDNRKVCALRWEELRAEAELKGACLRCLAASNWTYGSPKIVRHKSRCPRDARR